MQNLGKQTRTTNKNINNRIQRKMEKRSQELKTQ